MAKVLLTSEEPASLNGAPEHPVLDDLSVTLVAGRIRSAAPGLDEAVDADRLGFKRVWVPERYSNKECGALLGAMAARTPRVMVGPGPLTLSARPPLVTAAMGVTIQSMFGRRFTLGVGRGLQSWVDGHGFDELKYDALVDWCGIIKSLWRGETVNYEGPAGKYWDLRIDDGLDCPPPEIIFFHSGGPKASRVSADPVFDGCAVVNMTSPDQVRRSIDISRAECERIGRDPATLRCISVVTTAPDLDDRDTRLIVACRLAIYLLAPGFAEALIRNNGWDVSLVNEIRNHPLFHDIPPGIADHHFRRQDVLEPARLIPESWMRDVAAIGSASECVKRVREFRDAGADEIDLYGGAPAVHEKFVAEWLKASPSAG